MNKAVTEKIGIYKAVVVSNLQGLLAAGCKGQRLPVASKGVSQTARK